MSVALGKRKRAVKPAQARPVKKISVAPPPEPESDVEDKEALQDAFRRAFEARFNPIEDEKPKQEEEDTAEEEEDAQSEDDDWSGISEAEDDAVEVIEHTATAYTRDRADKAALKAFMSSKPPSSDSATTTAKPAQAKKDDKEPGDTNEADDLKNDLALQRLLKESHLLDSDFNSTDPTGKNRHKATDLRLLDLGSKNSIFAQKNMPKSHRVGIAKKVAEKEEFRRKEAKENGIVLERMKKKEGPSLKRERGVGAPSVGRFQGGTLRLSKRDVAGITGPKVSSRGGKGGRGGRGGRGGGRGGRGKRT